MHRFGPLLAGIAIMIGSYGVGRTDGKRASTAIAATCPPEPDDAWIERRFAQCSRVCVGGPFIADVTKDGAQRCECDRPKDRVGVTKLPQPTRLADAR